MAPPLFLLAPPRSYTSVTCAMLGQHPQMFGLPELNLFSVKVLKELWGNVSNTIGPNANRWNGLLRAVAEIYFGEQNLNSIIAAFHWLAARQEFETGKVYKELVNKMHPKILVEKSPAYTLDPARLERIVQTFPKARFIHLTRHPITQGKSVMSFDNGVLVLHLRSFDIEENFGIMDPQFAWYQVHLNILNFLEKLPVDQWLRIKGEDVMEKPEEELVRICKWLGIRSDNNAIQQMLKPEKSPFACLGPLIAMFGNDPKFLKNPSFKHHKPKLPPLDSPLPWRNDGTRLKKEIVELAKFFGYT